MGDRRNRMAYAALFVLAGVSVVGLGFAMMCLGLAGLCVAAPHHGMTQDLLWRAGPSPFLILSWICLAGALGASCWLLWKLKGWLEGGRPLRGSEVTAPVVGVACFWMLVWVLADVPALAQLAAPMWLAD